MVAAGRLRLLLVFRECNSIKSIRQQSVAVDNHTGKASFFSFSGASSPFFTLRREGKASLSCTCACVTVRTMGQELHQRSDVRESRSKKRGRKKT